MGNYHHLRYETYPVNFSVQKVIEYPYHWHDCLEIILVLKGSVFVDVMKDPAMIDPVLLGENVIYVSTMKEIHGIFKTDEENLVLLMHIDTDFIKQHFPGVSLIDFASLLNPATNIEVEKIEKIKEQVINLALLVAQSNGHFVEIEKATNELLFDLIENFNKIKRALNQKNDGKEYEARFTRIASYIISNFSSKNVLQEIAELEHLDAEYISHELKRYLGASFQVLINYYRIEQSLRLLLESDRTIADIAYDCGYSATKYFYRNFKKYYAPGPLIFRKKFQKLYKNMKYLKCYEEVDIPFELLNSKLSNKKLEEVIDWVEVDIREEGRPYLYCLKDTINVSSWRDLAQEEVQSSLRLMQDEIGFRYIGINDLFTEVDSSEIRKMEGNHDNLNMIFLFLEQLGLFPIIGLPDSYLQDPVYLNFIIEWIKDLESKYGCDTLKEWKFEVNELAGLNYDLIKDAVNPCSLSIVVRDQQNNYQTYNMLNDSFYWASKIMRCAIHESADIDLIYPVDDIDIDLPKEDYRIFQGKSGLLTANGLIKSSFYAYFLLAQLGSSVIKKGEDFLVTKKRDSIQILFHNQRNLYDFNDEQELTPEEYFKNLMNDQKYKKVNLNIRNMEGNYRVIRYELNYESCCIYYRWMLQRCPQYLIDRDIKILNKQTVPRVSFDSINDREVNFNLNLPPDGLELIILEKDIYKN